MLTIAILGGLAAGRIWEIRCRPVYVCTQVIPHELMPPAKKHKRGPLTMTHTRTHTRQTAGTSHQPMRRQDEAGAQSPPPVSQSKVQTETETC